MGTMTDATSVTRSGRRATQRLAVALSTALLILGLAAPVRGGIGAVTVVGSATGAHSTATVVCSFTSQINSFAFTLTNTSNITRPDSTSTITAVGYDLPAAGSANSSGLNGFTGSQTPSGSSSFGFSDADLGLVPLFNSAVLDFGFVTGGSFESGSVDSGLTPGESASFTVSGAAFTGSTESVICNAIFVRFEDVATGDGEDTGVPGDLGSQPDGRIKRSGGELRGNDVYNTTGNGQSVALTPRAGTLRRVYITIQNDGGVADSFSLTTTGTTPDGYELRYFRNRTNEELTAAIENDTFVTPVLQPGEHSRIRVRISTTAEAERGSLLTRLFTFTSETDGDAQDAVRLTVSRQ